MHSVLTPSHIHCSGPLSQIVREFPLFPVWYNYKVTDDVIMTSSANSVLGVLCEVSLHHAMTSRSPGSRR